MGPCPWYCPKANSMKYIGNPTIQIFSKLTNLNMKFVEKWIFSEKMWILWENATFVRKYDFFWEKWIFRGKCEFCEKIWISWGNVNLVRKYCEFCEKCECYVGIRWILWENVTYMQKLWILKENKSYDKCLILENC